MLAKGNVSDSVVNDNLQYYTAIVLIQIHKAGGRNMRNHKSKVNMFNC